MTAPLKPSEASEAARVLDDLLAALPPSKGRREARMREAVRRAARALQEPGVRQLDALALDIGSDRIKAASLTVAEDRAQRVIRRYYARQP